MTSLAQTWLNNLQFFGLNTPTPFFGTQLVLLSRQLSVVAESANEVRFTLDSVFVGPAERQTLQIPFTTPPAPADTPPMFLEDLLTWIDSFASEEGPRLIQEGGKFAVGQSFVPIATQLLQLVQELNTKSGVMNVTFTATAAPVQTANNILVNGISAGSGNATATVISDNLAFVTLNLNGITLPSDLGPYTVTITMRNQNLPPPIATATLQTTFTILP